MFCSGWKYGYYHMHFKQLRLLDIKEPKYIKNVVKYLKFQWLKHVTMETAWQKNLNFTYFLDPITTNTLSKL